MRGIAELLRVVMFVKHAPTRRDIALVHPASHTDGAIVDLAE